MAPALNRTRSMPADCQVDAARRGPSDTTWRPQMTLAIGQQRSEDGHTSGEDSPLLPNTPDSPSYGARSPGGSHVRKARSKLSLSLFQSLLQSGPPSPDRVSPKASSEQPAYFDPPRPILAYDGPAFGRGLEVQETTNDMRTNGIRVWYSSFTSVDWLHDTIKHFTRQASLRNYKSIRGKLWYQFDRSVGWIVVSIVGFLTAFVGWLILCSEMWLFDLKEGYCTSAWYKAKRFCCPSEDGSSIHPFLVTSTTEEACLTWRTWSAVFLPTINGGNWSLLEAEMMQYMSYTIIALSWATASCLLTLKLTASTSFISSKDSGLLTPTSSSGNPVGTDEAMVPGTKRKVLYYAAGSGIPEVKTILSGFVIHGYLGARTLFAKSTGLALSVASGLSLGMEGPLVHIASCIGNIVSRFFEKYENNEAKRREILSAACASGVAVAFGAPIGGVLFSLEEVSYFFPAKVMWRTFFCAMVAAMTLKFLDPFGSGKLVLFQVTYHKDWHAYELVFFLLLGVFGGVWGAWFPKLNRQWMRRVRNGPLLKNRPVVEVILVTLITCMLCFLNPYTRMGGPELIFNLFSECHGGSSFAGLCVFNPSKEAAAVIREIGVALIVKAGLTTVTCGMMVPAGLFIPSLGIGACFGRIFGIVVQWMHYSHPDSPVFKSCEGSLPCVIPGLYAMVGAGACLSGVSRSTVAVTVIMFELTDTLTYAVPVMLSVLVAKTVADALEPKGIYGVVFEAAQLPYLDANQTYAWGHAEVSQAADTVAVIRMEDDNTVQSLQDKLQYLAAGGHEDSGFPIVSEESNGRRLVGYIGASELDHALNRVADNPDERIRFGPTTPYHRGHTISASHGTVHTGNGSRIDPFDFSYYMDQAPLTVQSNSPLELVQQLFTKLGARYVIVIKPDGYYEGIIDKKAWVAFLGDLEKPE